MYSIAIDGPAGAGKSTIAKTIAKKLEFIYVDTGAMYRAMALYFIRHEIDPKNEEAINKACPDIHVSINYEDGVQQVLLNGENVNGLIRTEEVGNMASKTSAYKTVRATLLDLQRDLAKTANILMDGRDIGTNVLPDADLKIYLTASSKVRAERRYKELVEKGVKADFNKIEEDIIIRDRQDMEREIAPLKQAEDAVLVDSSDMTLIPGKWGIKERIYDLQGKSRTYHAAAHCQNVGIVVQSRCLCTEAVGAKCSTDAFYLVGCDGNTDSGSADQDSFLKFSSCNSLCHFFAVDRVIYRLCAAAAEIVVCNSSVFQMLLYFLHQFVTAVVTSKC